MNNFSKAHHLKLTANQGYVVLASNEQSLGDQNNNNESCENRQDYSVNLGGKAVNQITEKFN